jgi:hypothetical protein
MLVPQLTRPQSQFNAEESTEWAIRPSFSPVSVARGDFQRCPVKNLNLILSKESTAMKDVGTTVNRTMSQFNAEQSHEIARCLPLILFPAVIMKALKQKT